MPTISDFWSWFVANEDTYYMLHGMDLEDKDYHFECLLERLQEFDPCVSVILTGPKHLTKATLTFTADGNPNGFLYVQNLVEKAPTLPRWEFIAFIQPTVHIDACAEGTDPVYEFYRMPIKVSALYWLPLEPDEGDPPDLLHIIIYFTGFKECVKGLGLKQVDQNIYQMIQDLLGEKMLQRHIGNVYFDELNPKAEALPLYDLPSYIDELTDTE